MGSVDNVIETAIAAVAVEIDAAQSGKSSDRSYTIVEGKFITKADNTYLYQFKVAKQLPTNFDDAPVGIIISSNPIQGTIVNLEDFFVTIALSEYLGDYIAQASLTVDLTFILKRLKEALSEKAQGLATNQLVHRAFGFSKANRSDTNLKSDYQDLNSKQLQALKEGVARDFLLIWGPPGTGKTFVLARLLKELVLNGQSVLLVSNTNVAVDQALAKFIELAKEDEQLQLELHAGKFIRMGIPQLEDCELPTLEKVIDEKSANLNRLIVNKKEEAKDLLTVIGNLKEGIELLHKKNQVEEQLVVLKKIASKLNKELGEQLLKIQQLKRQIANFEQELNAHQQKKGIVALLSKIRISYIEKAIKNFKDELNVCEEKYQNGYELLEVKKREAEVKKNAFRELQHQITAKRTGIGSLIISDKELSVKKSELKALKAVIAELEKEVSELSRRVIQEAKIIACTCAKSFLDQNVKERVFHAVIADEASMISVPQILWCAGMATTKFICCGDFRQLPPISMIDNKKYPQEYQQMHNSIFEYNKIGISWESLGDPRLVMLEEQFRMPEKICQLVSAPMYGGRLKTHPLAPNVEKSLTLVSTSACNAWSDKTEYYSWFNWHHAFVAVELVRQLESQDIVILAPYRAQVELIRILLEEAQLEHKAKVMTIWKAQGSEGETIIFDTVCAPPFNKPGLWFSDLPGAGEGARLLNVALTRTKKSLFLISHQDYWEKHIKTETFFRQILDQFTKNGIIIDSREITKEAIPTSPGDRGEHRVLTFPADICAIFNETDFLTAFAGDVARMPKDSKITIFSPFLAERAIAHWSPILRNAIERGCEINIFTRKPGTQTAFLEIAEVEALIENLRSLGASVGFDSYLPGQKLMHHKVAILEFPDQLEQPIIWKGSMNPLGYYSSEELMDRTQSDELYGYISKILKLEKLRSALNNVEIAIALTLQLRKKLNAYCEKHNLPMDLKFGHRAKYPSFFMGCRRWKDGCYPINVELDLLNEVLAEINVRCTQQSCNAKVEAKKGSKGVYLRCSEGHFVNLGI